MTANKTIIRIYPELSGHDQLALAQKVRAFRNRHKDTILTKATKNVGVEHLATKDHPLDTHLPTGIKSKDFGESFPTAQGDMFVTFRKGPRYKNGTYTCGQLFRRFLNFLGKRGIDHEVLTKDEFTALKRNDS